MNYENYNVFWLERLSWLDHQNQNCDGMEEYYWPSDEEIQKACEEAEEMMNNMVSYGTIDKPLD